MKNRKKPTLGAVAGTVTYFVCAVVLGFDEELSFLISGAVATFVVERVGPIFGEKTPTPAR